MADRKRLVRRRKLRRGVLGCAIGASILLLAGAVLPADRVQRGEVFLARSRESIWRILLDLDGMPGWRSDLTRLERLPDRSGHPAWRETSRHGDRVVQLAVIQPPARLVMRSGDSGPREERVIELVEPPARNGTLVRVMERGTMAPVRRLLYRLSPGRADPPRFLEDLARLLGARPEVTAKLP